MLIPCAIGYGQIIVIVLVVILLFGGKKIPELMKGLGKGVKSFKDGVNEAKEEITNKTGLIFDPFIIKYPLELDYDEIKRIQENTLANIHLKEYEQEINACVILEKYRKEIEIETEVKEPSGERNSG